MDAARSWFKKLEDGDLWARAAWQKLIDITLVEFDKTYARLNVHFDTTHGESFYEPMLNDVVQEAIDKGVAKVEPGGAVAAYFDDKLPSCLLRKTDGATLYQTRDVATCLYRWREYGPNLARNIYIVGAEQKLHFQQVFEITRRMGYTEIADRSVHIPTGSVLNEKGERFSGRKGNAIFLEEVMDEAIERAEATIREKIAEGKTELTEDAVASVSEIVGIGGLIYADLYQGPDRNIKFEWDKIMSYTGNTALYIQYTHARCRSILRDAGADFPPQNAKQSADASLLIEPEEQAVLKQLSRLPHTVREAGEKNLPAAIAEWTYALAQEFSRFYEKHKVLKAATPELRAARLNFVAAVAQGLRNGLALLGIQAPEKM
jgi:arginyl-tRNA synthetase